MNEGNPDKLREILDAVILSSVRRGHIKPHSEWLNYDLKEPPKRTVRVDSVEPDHQKGSVKGFTKSPDNAEPS